MPDGNKCYKEKKLKVHLKEIESKARSWGAEEDIILSRVFRDGFF